jgi:hypothetical protein
MVNEPGEGIQHYMEVRFDKRTLGLYWRIPMLTGIKQRILCHGIGCSCGNGHIEWTPVFRHRHDAWTSHPGSFSQEFFTDLMSTHDIITTAYGAFTCPRTAVEHIERALGKRARDDDDNEDDDGAPEVPNKVQVVVDLTASDEEEEEEEDGTPS